MSRQTDKHPGVERFVRAGQKLCSLIPEFALLWGRVPSIKHAKVGTACVDKNFNILVDGDWALTKSEPDLLFVAGHEVMHPLLSHHARAVAVGLCDERGKIKHGKQKAAQLWGITTDMVINAALGSLGLTIPKEGCMPPPGYSGDLNAEALWRALGGDQMTDPPGGGGKGKGKPKVGEGCGVDQDGFGAGAGEYGGDVDLDQVRAEVAMVARSRDSGGILARILAPAQPQVEDWERVLRGAYREAAARRGYDQTTYGRPKRAGDALLPRYKSTQPSLSVLIDVSGSMSGPLIDRIVDQVFSLSRAYPYVDCALITHHSDVAWAGWINGQTDRTKISSACEYSGGTDATSAYARSEEMQGKVDVLVHLTDTYLGSTWPDVAARKLIIGDYSTPGSPGTPPPSGMRVMSVKMSAPGDD